MAADLRDEAPAVVPLPLDGDHLDALADDLRGERLLEELGRGNHERLEGVRGWAAWRIGMSSWWHSVTLPQALESLLVVHVARTTVPVRV
ncbi:MAG TPA: hypothetical protein VMK12_19840 [Anaeromyxobacteraceae bacterium]|nr:hypothetical protein [Anaeromyxobacteraceae bacterium]